MSYVITERCERCDFCIEVCPSDVIFFVEGDPAWPTYYIYADECIECGSCEVECPEGAIFYVDELPDKYVDAVEKNVDFFESGPGQDLI